MTDTPSAEAAQVPARNKPATDEFLRVLRRRGRQFRKAEAARKAEKQFRIRCERAALMIARKGVDTNIAVRSVGMGESTKARETVKALCDVRGIARRYWWGYPKWQTSAATSVTVLPRKEVVRRDDASVEVSGEKK